MDVVVVGNLLTALIPVLVPIVVAGLKSLVPSIPKPMLPVTGILCGTLIDLANLYLTGQGHAGAWGAALGAAGVGVREVVDQFRKSLQAQLPPPPNIGDLRPVIVMALFVPMLVGCMSPTVGRTGISIAVLGGQYDATRQLYDAKQADVGVDNYKRWIDFAAKFTREYHRAVALWTTAESDEEAAALVKSLRAELRSYTLAVLKAGKAK